jgi:hypothetical protein
VHHGHASGNVPGARAEIDESFACAALIPGRHRRHADLEFERGSHAVVRLEMVILVVLAVRVKIDEPRRHDQAADIHHSPAFERRRGDSLDALAADTDIANRVEPRFRIHYAAVGENSIVDLTLQ